SSFENVELIAKQKISTPKNKLLYVFVFIIHLLGIRSNQIVVILIIAANTTRRVYRLASMKACPLHLVWRDEEGPDRRPAIFHVS
ncbi:MAG: hypothetical protein ACI92E_003086, partial [Oceanicoccus sp.]